MEKQLKTNAQIFSKNISKSGYGENYETILKIMNKLSEDEIEILAYNCYRTAEKLGENAFELIEN